MQRLAIDLFCGLGGWSQGLIAEGFYVVGFDIERHEYDGEKYPGQLVLQSVLTLHGSQFKDASIIVASPPCQAYSYMAMPWKKAKAKAADIRADESGEKMRNLRALFDACFRIQREACEAAGHHIPLVVENVRGAQPWVGRARWNFGSFYLWGDMPVLMPMIKPKAKVGSLGWADQQCRAEREAIKVPGFRFDGSGKSFQGEAVKQGGNKSPSRKAAAARIAKIPFSLAQHIARHAANP
jgi:hypothetical protein